MVNSQESSPDRLLHDFQAPASAPVHTSPSVLGSYDVPSASAEGENKENKSRQEEGSERKDVGSDDDEPLRKLKRKSSSLGIKTSGQKKTLVVSVATAKPMVKGSLMSNAEAGMPKRTRMDVGRDSDVDEDDSLEKKKKKKKTVQREDEESRNRQHEDPKVAKRKRLEVSSRGREEGGGGEKEEGHGVLSAADKRFGAEVKKGVTSQVGEGKNGGGRGEPGPGPVIVQKKQLGLESLNKQFGTKCAGSSLQHTEKTKLNPSVKKESYCSVTHNAAVAVLRYDAESMVSSAVGGMSVEVVVKSEPFEDYDWHSMVSAAARMEQEVAVKVEPHADANEGIKDAREEGAKKRIKDAREDGAKHAEKGIKDETEGGGKGAEKGVAKGATKEAERGLQKSKGGQKPVHKEWESGRDREWTKEMRTGGKRDPEEMGLKKGEGEAGKNFETTADADVMVEKDEGDEGNEKEDGAKGAESTEDLQKKGKLKVLSRLPLVLPDKLSRLKVLVECDGDAADLDLSGDVGAVGRLIARRDAGEDGQNNQTLLLDIKGTVYKASIVPSTTFFTINPGPTEAKVDAVMNDFMILQKEANIINAEAMIEGVLEDVLYDSDSELGVAGNVESERVGKRGKPGGKQQKDDDDDHSEDYKFEGGWSDEEYSPISKRARVGRGDGQKGGRKVGGGGGRKFTKREKETALKGRGPKRAARGKKGTHRRAGKRRRSKAKLKASGSGKGRGTGLQGKEGKQRTKESFKGM